MHLHERDYELTILVSTTKAEHRQTESNAVKCSRIINIVFTSDSNYVRVF